MLLTHIVHLPKYASSARQLLHVCGACMLKYFLFARMCCCARNSLSSCDVMRKNNFLYTKKITVGSYKTIHIRTACVIVHLDLERARSSSLLRVLCSYRYWFLLRAKNALGLIRFCVPSYSTLCKV